MARKPQRELHFTFPSSSPSPSSYSLAYLYQKHGGQPHNIMCAYFLVRFTRNSPVKWVSQPWKIKSTKSSNIIHAKISLLVFSFYILYIFLLLFFVQNNKISVFEHIRRMSTENIQCQLGPLHTLTFMRFPWWRKGNDDVWIILLSCGI